MLFSSCFDDCNKNNIWIMLFGSQSEESPVKDCSCGDEGKNLTV